MRRGERERLKLIELNKEKVKKEGKSCFVGEVGAKTYNQLTRKLKEIYFFYWSGNLFIPSKTTFSSFNKERKSLILISWRMNGIKIIL